MRYLKYVTVCLPLLVAHAGWGQQADVPDPSARIPDRIPPVAAERQAPEWVSAELVTRDGELQRELFAPEELPILEMNLESGRRALASYLAALPEERPADPCVYVVTSDHRIPPPARTLEGLAESSTGVYLGTVVAERPGLLRGMPRALLRVELDTALKHELPSPVPRTVLVAYPGVKMQVGEVCLAVRSLRSPASPEIGRRILVFTSAKVPPGGNTILTPADEEFFFELPDGRASLPAHYGELLSPTGGPVTLDFVVEQTEKALAAAREGGS